MRKLPAIAINLRAYRKARGLTQKRLAALAKCSSVGMIESGRRKAARYESLAAYARVLKCTVADLYAAPSRPGAAQ